LENTAAQAYQYRLRPIAMGGGHGSYIRFGVPVEIRSNENGSYEARIMSADLLRIYGTSSLNPVNAISVYEDSDGRLPDWAYEGGFK